MLAAVLVLLVVTHQVGDYWIQTPSQASRKGLAGWPGRRSCAAHVATYTALMAFVLVALDASRYLALNPRHVLAGLLVSAVSHYVADRRTPLRRLALAVGKDPAWLDDGGLAFLDQAWHHGWLLVSAVVMV